MRIAVTGATGHFGRHAIATLLARGVAASDLVAVVRNPDKAADLAAQGVTIRVAPYEDRAALVAALEGVERLLFVSGAEVGQRVLQHTNVVEAAKDAGVGFVAYTSVLNAPESTLGLAEEHRVTEKLLKDSGIEHALLRNGWYWENYLPQLEPARATGHLVGAAGTGRVAGAARADYAEAAVAVILGAPRSEVYELAGAPALDYPAIAEAIGEVIGRDVDYVDQSPADYAIALEDAGTPGPLAQFLAAMDAAIAGGALDSESQDLQRLLGRPSTTAVEVLRG